MSRKPGAVQVLSEEGNPATGTEEMLAGDTLYRSIGGECFRSYFLALLAEAYGKSGRPDEGLRLVGEAIENTSRTEERVYEAELYRVKGELLLRQTEPATQQAEGCFLKAIEVAQREGARSLELRATTSVSRLWQRGGQRDDARRLLGDIYGWFTEGYDTPDLKEAKALLEELT